MVDTANLLGIEAMTGHWEFTYGEATLRANLERFKGEFLAQNVFLTEGPPSTMPKAFDPASGRVFKPSVIKEIGGSRIAVIGQAFPYVPIAHQSALRRTGIRHLRRGTAKPSTRIAATTRSMLLSCFRTTAWMST
jgi:2',3'-cyclic-nucleotide 2'-phosphodiesterase (5'-nucleotidase family)